MNKNVIRLSAPAAALLLLGVLLVSGAGGAVGATLITGADIQDGTVAGIDVRDDSLTGVDVRNESLSGVDVRNESLAGVDLRDGTVAPADLRDHPMWAIVGASGTGFLDPGRGVLGVQKVATGIYLVQFARPVVGRPILLSVYQSGNFEKRSISFRRCADQVGTCDSYQPGLGPEWVVVITDYALSGREDTAFQVVALPPVPAAS